MFSGVLALLDISALKAVTDLPSTIFVHDWPLAYRVRKFCRFSACVIASEFQASELDEMSCGFSGRSTGDFPVVDTCVNHSAQSEVTDFAIEDLCEAFTRIGKVWCMLRVGPT